MTTIVYFVFEPCSYKKTIWEWRHQYLHQHIIHSYNYVTNCSVIDWALKPASCPPYIWT